MKPLLLSTSLEGGAGGAALRLHQGLRRIGVSSQVLVRKKITEDETEIFAVPKRLLREFDRLRPKFDRLPLRLYPHRQGFYSPQWFPDGLLNRVRRLNADVINLHWVLNGFVRIETIAKLPKPLVWTLPDMWAFTGGCDYSQECDRYIRSCGHCPVLASSREQDLSRRVWKRKQRAWRDIDFTVVTPSSWLAERARASSLFRQRRIEVIPYGLDTNLFRPVDKVVARNILRLPEDKKIVLFGAWAADPRKGLHLLQSALQRLSNSGWAGDIELAVFGRGKPTSDVKFGFKTHYLGRFSDPLALSIVYSAAAVVVAPSIQEGFGQVASESLACGTPAVVFKNTGLSDIVDHQQNGYTAKAFDIDDLAQGIVWVIEEEERYQNLAQQAREKAVKEYSLELQAQRYLRIFNEVATPS